MIHHGIHISGRHEEAKSRLPEYGDAFGIPPIRLGNDADSKTEAFQKTRQNRRTERRMIHIGITDHIHKVRLLNSARLHILTCNRQELVSVWLSVNASCHESFLLSPASSTPCRVRSYLGRRGTLLCSLSLHANRLMTRIVPAGNSSASPVLPP